MPTSAVSLRRCSCPGCTLPVECVCRVCRMSVCRQHARKVVGTLYLDGFVQAFAFVCYEHGA